MFDDFSEQDLVVYNEMKNIDTITWFNTSLQRQAVIDMKEKPCKYVLIKLLKSHYKSKNMDVQYIGFVGYSGGRCFASSKLC